MYDRIVQVGDAQDEYHVAVEAEHADLEERDVDEQEVHGERQHCII